MKTIQYSPIGIIHSPFSSPEEAPIQPRLSDGAKGRIVLQPDYEEGLTDLARFSHIVIVYHFHLSKTFTLIAKPSHGDSSHGVFSTRSPNRPNSIGLSIVRLESIEKNSLYVTNIDVVDGTPLLDIKPFIPTLERQYGATLGWLADEFDGI